MSESVDISYWRLSFVYLLAMVPFFIMFYSRVPLLKKYIIAIIRMTLQLAFVGLYLDVVFLLNNLWLNLLWILVMITVATFGIIDAHSLKRRYFFFPIMASVGISAVANVIFFNCFIAHISDLFDSVYLIPLCGLLLGNTLKACIQVSNTYFDSLISNESLYLFYYSLSANKHVALQPIVSKSLTNPFRANIADIAATGLVALPGMMAGQILSGASPLVAVKYQGATMISIFSTVSISCFLLVKIYEKVCFSKFGVLKKDIFVS